MPFMVVGPVKDEKKKKNCMWLLPSENLNQMKSLKSILRTKELGVKMCTVT